MVSGFGNITTIQELNKTTCANYNIGTTARLRDTRDNKLYWVAKLADGNCWMTQNLAYDGGGTTGDPATWGNDNTAAKYYNPGLYVYTTPTTQNSCSDSNGLSSCTTKGWYNVTSMHASNDLDMAQPVDFVNDIYDAHYLSGNYYSWQAATNGTGSSATTNGAQASSSICPAGWSLPLSKTTNNSTSGSFYNLLSKYGLQSSLTAGNYDIRLAPLYFVYGGYVTHIDNPELDMPANTLNNAGSYGYYWSSTAYNADGAYGLYFTTRVDPSNIWNRYIGMSVRCVAR